MLPCQNLSLGCFLENPEKILARTDRPILEPLMDYEIEGQIRNVVFSCGVVLRDNTLFVYYGGGDTVLGVATASLDDVIAQLKNCVYE